MNRDCVRPGQNFEGHTIWIFVSISCPRDWQIVSRLKSKWDSSQSLETNKQALNQLQPPVLLVRRWCASSDLLSSRHLILARSHDLRPCRQCWLSSPTKAWGGRWQRGRGRERGWCGRGRGFESSTSSSPSAYHCHTGPRKVNSSNSDNIANGAHSANSTCQTKTYQKTNLQVLRNPYCLSFHNMNTSLM